jgi:hypothetical protein
MTRFLKKNDASIYSPLVAELPTFAEMNSGDKGNSPILKIAVNVRTC